MTLFFCQMMIGFIWLDLLTVMNVLAKIKMIIVYFKAHHKHVLRLARK